jgi:hypothetical protein
MDGMDPIPPSVPTKSYSSYLYLTRSAVVITLPCLAFALPDNYSLIRRSSVQSVPLTWWRFVTIQYRAIPNSSTLLGHEAAESKGRGECTAGTKQHNTTQHIDISVRPLRCSSHNSSRYLSPFLVHNNEYLQKSSITSLTTTVQNCQFISESDSHATPEPHRTRIRQDECRSLQLSPHSHQLRKP